MTEDTGGGRWKVSDSHNADQSVTVAVDEESWITALAGAKAVAAAEAIAASRGRAAERLPDEIHRWLEAANPRADGTAADLALRVLAKVQGEDSELQALWEEVDGSRWRGALDDLRRRLMPGYSSPPLNDAGLASLVAGDTAFLAQGSFSLLMGLSGSRARGN
jgi:Domain of unknown function (DUF4259)